MFLEERDQPFVLAVKSDESLPPTRAETVADPDRNEIPYPIHQAFGGPLHTGCTFLQEIQLR